MGTPYFWADKFEWAQFRNVRRNPANPTWDPVLIPGGIPGEIGRIPDGIPTGIMERLGWDPIRDPANLGWDPTWDPT